MASVKVRLKSDIELSDGGYAIIIQVIHNRKKKTFHLGYSALENQWSKEKDVPLSNHPDHKIIKSRIKSEVLRLKNIIAELENRGRPFTLQDIERKYKNKLSDDSFAGYCDLLVKSLKETGRHGNAIVYQSLADSFNDFAGKRKYLLYEMDYQTVNRYYDYLKKKVTVSKDGKSVKRLTPNGISFYMRTLRAIINRAIKAGLLDEKEYPFKNITVKSEKTRKRAVNKDVIKLIEDLEVLPTDNLQLYKDLFLFSFYNRGISFVDMAFLRVGNISDGRLNYKRQKTGQQFSIKITEKAKAIIDRYNDLKDLDSYIFPIIQRKGQEYLDYRNAMRLMNKKLKKISELLKLDVNLSSYVARHSWATIAKRAGVSTAVISEGLGHTTEEITQVYLDSFENDTLDAANEIVTS